MNGTQKDSPSTKLLLTIIGLLVIIILLLLGWKISKIQFFGVELAPPATSTPELPPTAIPQIQPSSTPQQVEPQPIATNKPVIVFTPTQEVMWQDLGIFYATGATTIGNSDKWMVFQVWDGVNTSSTVHGIVEPGWYIVIPTIVQGTTWIVSGYDTDYMFSRVLQMRDEAVRNSKIAVPPLLYIGANPAPDGYTTQLPSGWSIKK